MGMDHLDLEKVTIDESSCFISSPDISDEESDPQEQTTLSILDKLRLPMPSDLENKRLSRIPHMVKEGAQVLHLPQTPRESPVKQYPKEQFRVSNTIDCFATGVEKN